MQQTTNQGYSLIENTDTISQSLNAWNGNFKKLDKSITSDENRIEALSDNYSTNEATGKILELEDSASAGIVDIKIGENTDLEQDGEPTPNEPIAIKVVEGSNTLVSQSKNIVDWYNPNLTRCTSNFVNDTLTLIGEGANTMARYNITQFIKGHAGQKIHFGYKNLDKSNFNSSSTTIAQLQITVDSTSTYFVMGTSGGSLYNYTIPEDTSEITAVYFRIITNNSSTETTSTLIITNPQLELGEVSTSYTKYSKQSYPITLPTGMFLGSIEDASNYIRQYSAYYPQTAEAFMYDVTDGQTYNVSCAGMRATTVVRTQK